MPDIREQLRRIETSRATRPVEGDRDARHERPTRDGRRASSSFRPRGAQARRRRGRGGTPGRGGVRPGGGRRVGGIPGGGARHRSRRRSDIPDGWERCTNARARLLDRLPGRLVHHGCLRRRAGPGERLPVVLPGCRSVRRATSCPRAGATRSRWRSEVRSTRCCSRRPIPRPPTSSSRRSSWSRATAPCGSSTRR